MKTTFDHKFQLNQEVKVRVRDMVVMGEVKAINPFISSGGVTVKYYVTYKYRGVMSTIASGHYVSLNEHSLKMQQIMKLGKQKW